MLRHSAAFDQWMVNIITAAEDKVETRPLAEALCRSHPQIVSVVNNVTARKAGVAIGEYEVPLVGADRLKDRIGSYEFEISANSFFQTNTRGAARLYATAREYARLTGRENVFDLYSGTGTIAICLADVAARITGFEIVESAVTDARRNCRINRIENCDFVLGDIRSSLSRTDNRPDVIIIDPPRSGMHPDIVQTVIDLAPERIVYVSCNPATLARDAALMQGFYSIAEVQPVDMFPHTYHIEAVARLERLPKIV
jgi:23S rRNA (uracil1939-C5)-methyltransferase